MPKMTKRRIVLFIFLFFFGVVTVLFISKINPKSNQVWIDMLIATAFPLLIGIGSYVSQPFSQWLDEFLDNSNPVKKCIIYFYGTAGSGKTSLVSSWLTKEEISHQSTNKADYYELELPRNSESIKLVALDYKGQKASQVTVNIPDKILDVIGSKGNRLINAAVFIVDIIGRYDDYDNLLDTPDRQVSWLKVDTEKKISKRVKEHISYINGSLEIVFAVIYSTNLKSVRLVINKCDLIEELLTLNYLNNPEKLDYTEYARNIFLEIEEEIKKACRSNNISDFSVETISAIKDENTRKLLTGILKTYEGATNSSN